MMEFGRFSIGFIFLKNPSKPNSDAEFPKSNKVRVNCKYAEEHIWIHLRTTSDSVSYHNG